MSQKYAAYDASGAIVAFHDEVDSPVPSGINAIPISHEEWQTCLATPGHTVQDGALIAPTPPSTEALLARAKSTQVLALRHAEQMTLAQGFSSDALGQPHTYPSTTVDIQALSDAVAGSRVEGVRSIHLWCTDPDGNLASVAHSPAQLQQVKHDWLAFRFASHKEIASLVEQVKAATNVAAVQTITAPAVQDRSLLPPMSL